MPTFVAVDSATTVAQHGGGMGGVGGMGGFGWWPTLWSLVLLSLVALLAYGVLTQRRPPATERDDTDDALATLRTRYAHGDLSDEEFEERRQRLEE